MVNLAPTGSHGLFSFSFFSVLLDNPVLMFFYQYTTGSKKYHDRFRTYARHVIQKNQVSRNGFFLEKFVWIQILNKLKLIRLLTLLQVNYIKGHAHNAHGTLSTTYAYDNFVNRKMIIHPRQFTRREQLHGIPYFH